MKKILLIASVLFSFTILNAQNCREIAASYYGNIEDKLEDCAQEKIDWLCAYSHNAFFLTNDVPQEAKVFNISEVKNVFTGEPFATGVVDLNTLNYYAFDFQKFQFQDYNKTIYFVIQNEDYHYLAVRSNQEIYERTEFPEKYNQDK